MGEPQHLLVERAQCGVIRLDDAVDERLGRAAEKRERRAQFVGDEPSAQQVLAFDRRMVLGIAVGSAFVVTAAITGIVIAGEEDDPTTPATHRPNRAHRRRRGYSVRSQGTPGTRLHR